MYTNLRVYDLGPTDTHAGTGIKNNAEAALQCRTQKRVDPLFIRELLGMLVLREYAIPALFACRPKVCTAHISAYTVASMTLIFFESYKYSLCLSRRSNLIYVA